MSVCDRLILLGPRGPPFFVHTQTHFCLRLTDSDIKKIALIYSKM